MPKYLKALKMTHSDLLKWRTAIHKTQAEMAEYLGIGLRTYCKYETKADNFPLPRAVESRWLESMDANKSDFVD